MRKRGFTIIELLVVVSIIALLIGILLPAIGRAKDAALVTQSLSNLRNLGTAHATYASEYNGRQWTAAADDFGVFGGNCAQYLAFSCPGQMLLGWDQNGAMWGYFLGSQGACAEYGYPGNCGNWIVYWPNSWTANDVFGFFRLANCKAFNTYLNGRFYDPVYYAPKDKVILDQVEDKFDLPGEFWAGNGTDIVFSSYVTSPAAQWNAEVLRNENDGGFQSPSTLPSGWKSPTADQARYPDLKTRMLEHHWLQNAQGDINPSFAGGDTPYYFNHGYNSAPATLFYDGHCRIFGVAEAMDADSRHRNQTSNNPNIQTEYGLWSRDSDLGGNGYYMNVAYDFLVETSYHILTTDGIFGRDSVGFGTG
jgi:prepilin-type N-terminal cleavage/methylation domain-containing protein